MAAAPSATVADPPPKPPPDKLLPDNPRYEKTLIHLSSVTATDLGQTSRSSPAIVGTSTLIGVHPPLSDNTKKPAAMASKPSFAEVAKNGSTNNKRKSGPQLHMFGQPPPLPGAKIITENGVDILVFEDEATDLLAASLKWALVGKFSHNLPSTQIVGNFLSNLKLRGEFELKWLSHRQLLIVLTEEEDYVMIWTKGLWFIDRCPMRTLKWTPTFNARIECPFAPVWASLPGLHVHLFEKRALHLIASQLGRPLMVDTPTATRKRVAFARICVEMDLLSPVKDMVLLNINGQLLQQPIIYEDLPRYCSHCSHLGHTVDQCFVKNVDLKIVYDERRVDKKRKIIGKDKIKWVVKDNLNNKSGSAYIDTVHPSQQLAELLAEKTAVGVDVHGDVELGDAILSSKLYSFDGSNAVEEGEITGGFMLDVVHDNVAVHEDDGRGHANVLADVAVLHVHSGVPSDAHAHVVDLHGTVQASATYYSNMGKQAEVEGIKPVVLADKQPLHDDVGDVEHVVSMPLKTIGGVVRGSPDFFYIQSAEGVVGDVGLSQDVKSGSEMSSVHRDIGQSSTLHVTDMDDVILDAAGLDSDVYMESAAQLQNSGSNNLHATVAVDVSLHDDADDVTMKSKPTLHDEDGNGHAVMHVTTQDGVAMTSAVHLLNFNSQAVGTFSCLEHADSTVVGVAGTKALQAAEELVQGVIVGVNKGSLHGVVDQHAVVEDVAMHYSDFNVVVDGDIAMMSAALSQDVGTFSKSNGLIFDGDSTVHHAQPTSQMLENEFSSNIVHADVVLLDMQSGIKSTSIITEALNDDDFVISEGPVVNATATDVCEQEEYLADVAGLFAQSEDSSYDTAMISSSNILNNNSKILGPNLTEFTHIATPGPTTTQILDLMISNSNKNNPNFDAMNVEWKLADMFPEPLQTVYPEDEYYSNEEDKMREFFNQESPRSNDDESSENYNFDDIDDDFGDRPFHRTCSYPNLNDYKKAELTSGYGGRITRSMAKNRV